MRVPVIAWNPPRSARVARIRARLRELYGMPAAKPHRRPLDELILTVLSQSTNDRNRDVAFLTLRERFSDWAAVRDAPVAEIEAAIRPGGISKVKSVRIQQILRAIGDPLSLDWLAGEPLEQARDYLCALPGVGRKTAACVLLFSFGMREVPVDTHVSRVGTRLALAASRRSISRAARRAARADPAWRRARAAPQHAAPRTAHVPRAGARVRELRSRANVPEGRVANGVRLTRSDAAG